MSSLGLNGPRGVAAPRVSVAAFFAPRPSHPSSSSAPSSIAPPTDRGAVPSTSSSPSSAMGDSAADEAAATAALERERQARQAAEDSERKLADWAQRACEARDIASADALQLLRQRDRQTARAEEAEEAARAAERTAQRAAEREAAEQEWAAEREAAEREADAQERAAVFSVRILQRTPLLLTFYSVLLTSLRVVQK